MDRIRENGLRIGDGKWTIVVPDLKEDFHEPISWKALLDKKDLSRKDTMFREVPTICACADADSASYYACVHNRTKEHDTPILIEFGAPRDYVWVDGRDFLYTVFQLWDRKSSSDVQKAHVKRVIVQAFGNGILRYLERTLEEGNPDIRLALCDLAINDNAVIEDHSRNKLWLKGRYGTIFRNAFSVRDPVPKSSIADVRVLDSSFSVHDPELTLASVLG